MIPCQEVDFSPDIVTFHEYKLLSSSSASYSLTIEIPFYNINKIEMNILNSEELKQKFFLLLFKKCSLYLLYSQGKPLM